MTRARLAPPAAKSRISEQDIYLFNEGSHFGLHERLGSCLTKNEDGVAGASFAVWAPNAQAVSVMGDFNGWDKSSLPLSARGDSGIWEAFVPGALRGQSYKYHVRSRFNGISVDKADPFASHTETPPKTASILWDLDYKWNDRDWMQKRGVRNALGAPMSVYEVHLGSWKRPLDDPKRLLTYRELAESLPAYARDCGFTHVELMPIMEHPFYGSWGYQTTGYFAPSSRYGTPQDFMHLIDRLHQVGVGVILDWVPSHFPTDEHGLAYFDGTHLFEHADPKQGFHPDWKSAIFNYSRNEVRSFLISNALFWLEKYHADGLRVDAVASMLYLDYSRKEGEWIPNAHGGRENLEAISFLRRLNEEVYKKFPDVQTIAEESTSWPMVSRPTYLGGLGFGLKWDMGWMHDTLSYMSQDPVHRRFHHNEITFRMIYAFHENFMLPLSHDEVVFGKGSLVRKMPGDDWQKFANLRSLYAYMFAQPGKKLLFMGAELGQWNEWNHERSLDWHLLDGAPHAGLTALIRDLNRVYREEPALHALDSDPAGFSWVDASDAGQSIISFLRLAPEQKSAVLVVMNLTPVPRHGYRIGVPREGYWGELLNTDAGVYGGSGQGNLGGLHSEPVPCHGRPHSLTLTLPPLSAVYLKSP